MNTLSTLRASTNDLSATGFMPSSQNDLQSSVSAGYSGPHAALEAQTFVLARGSTIPLVIPPRAPFHHDHCDYIYATPLQDGPGGTTWFCPECGDGPIGGWNPTCSSCGYCDSSRRAA